MIWPAIGWLLMPFAYSFGFWVAMRRFRKPKLVEQEPESDRYHEKLHKVRSAEGVRELAAFACRRVAQEAAAKARYYNDQTYNTSLSAEERERAVASHKAWMHTCNAAERCEREVRIIGLEP